MALLTVNTDAEYALFNPTQQIYAALAIPYTYNGIEIVKFRQIVFTIGSSCRDFLGN